MLKTIDISGLMAAMGLSIISLSLGNQPYAEASDSSSTPAAPAHSALFDKISLRYSGVVQGISFPYYSQAERIQTITSLIQSIQADYSLLLYKQHTLGVDIVQIGQDAISAEQEIPDVLTEPEQAIGNLKFLDRMRKIAANFQDSHFRLDAADAPSPVSLGFVVSNIGAQYLVTSLRPNYLTNQTLKFDYSSEIAVGDEVVSIDGQDPLTAAQALKPYLPASSDLYRTNSAIFSLTSRDFALPTQATSAVVLRRNGSTFSLNLPWGAASITRSDQATYLKNINIPPLLQHLGLDVDSVFDEPWRSNIGVLKNKIVFSDAARNTTPVIKLGTLESETGPVGYLQIRSFSFSEISKTEEVSSEEHLGTKSSKAHIKSMKLLPTLPDKIYKFDELIALVIGTFKAKSVPLILDLRYNSGGDNENAITVVKDLVPTNETIAPLSEMYRITNLAWETVDHTVARGMENPENLGSSDAKLAAAFSEARKSGSAYTEILPAQPLTSDAIQGYDQKVIILTSSFCVSACEVTALLLKSANRAIIMGESTNRTGAGFRATFEVPDFTDTNHILAAHLPNALFGRPLQKGEDPKTVSVETIEAENRPTQPDILLEPSLNDLKNGNSDLISAAVAQLTTK